MRQGEKMNEKEWIERWSSREEENRPENTLIHFRQEIPPGEHQ